MLEIEQLEKEWRIYRLKRLRPYILTSVLIAGAAVSALYWPQLSALAGRSSASRPDRTETIQKRNEAVHITQKEETLSEKKENPAADSLSKTDQKPDRTEKRPPVTKKKADAGKTTATVLKEEKEIVLNPDTEFLNDFTQSIGAEKKKSRVVKSAVRHETIPMVPKKPKVSKKETEPKLTEIEKEPVSNIVVETTKPEPKKRSSLVIQTKQTNNTLEYLIERFNQNRDPKLATYIAKSFYKKGNYKETVRWSIVANSLDPSGEESWMLFAKAKVKLGQREDAINALRIYLNQYSSKKVKSYLESLESGF